MYRAQKQTQDNLRIRMPKPEGAAGAKKYARWRSRATEPQQRRRDAMERGRQKLLPERQESDGPGRTGVDAPGRYGRRNNGGLEVHHD